MVEAAGFSTTGPQPQPQHMHCRAIPCPLFNSVVNITTWMGGPTGQRLRRDKTLKPWKQCWKQWGGLSRTNTLYAHTHTHIQAIHMPPYSSTGETCTSTNAHLLYISLFSTYTWYTHTHTHTHIHIQLTFIRGLRGPAVQCSSKLWTARIRGSRALIWESESQRQRAAVTIWRLLSWDASKTTQDFKGYRGSLSHTDAWASLFLCAH